MVADLERAKENLINYLTHEIADERVVQAMRRVPREAFVPPEHYHEAYDDRPLSIGFGQTISQPFIVALMVQALELKGNEKVLELGTGSGYEAAILAELAGEIVTVEIIPQLAESAKRVLEKLGYSNIKVRIAGKSLGWSEEAPYEAIIVSAGAPSVPQVFLDQLAWKGRLVIPVGSRWQQELLKIKKYKKGNKVENLGGCYFVPLIGEGAWKE
ncbi:MAG: protein-L-isoaspartate O-methyltransferase [Chloroflexi bacterium CG_4_9_14_3_um_filter_45_9]|nr:MAG: protein-L-isoaspartate O-methyltransferase [Chloroflexi bacterium CG08_land_8_20_14_0_20_45_12]PIX27284.1 MAG: protein-L-isoaspartate O-methyltransferase [Chloroflexi bacterium CG_4_8_14_3_um_filter_45_15]PJB48254.1 MAG: protein-L-isoaspartate O-methyltransferase [Chloroflexi bacterium CG_4_9_14_3_um_filter_45_9]